MKKELAQAFERLFNNNLYEDIKEQMGDSPSTILTYTIEEQKEADLDIIKQALRDKDKRMRELNIENTNLDIQCDDLRGEVKELQSKLNAIEERIMKVKNDWHIEIPVEELEQIIGGNNEKI